MLSDVSSRQAEREDRREHPSSNAAQVAHRDHFDADPLPSSGVAQVLPGLKIFESITVPFTAPGSDQS